MLKFNENILATTIGIKKIIIAPGACCCCTCSCCIGVSVATN